jgi:hypothetical protein
MRGQRCSVLHAVAAQRRNGSGLKPPKHLVQLIGNWFALFDAGLVRRKLVLREELHASFGGVIQGEATDRNRPESDLHGSDEKRLSSMMKYIR